MLFSSPTFLFLFLPAIVGVYFLAPAGGQNLLLLLASLFFYAWGEPTFLPVLLCSIAVNFGLGLWIDRTRRRRSGPRVLGLAVTVNLVLLIVFKYTGFLVGNINALLAPLHLPTMRLPSIALPLGISFFTFHALSYLIDVYRREAAVQRNPVAFALYMALFPQLIAGPIVRYYDIASQLAARTVTRAGFAIGVRRFIVGLGKKVLIANTVAVPTDAIFALPPGQLTAGLTWLGIVCYTIQIYFDFSGYSDMAIGLARLFGFELLENFNYPYVSRSLIEFWRRWHISLSNWFRDYLYIPLGGNRRVPVRVYGNLVTVFFLCGLWHGASWTFIVWGLLHGLFLVVERIGFGRWLARQWALVQHAYLLLVVVITWVFFRAPMLSGALAYLSAMAGYGHGLGIEYHVSLYLNREVFAALVVGVLGSTPALTHLAAWKERPGMRVLDASMAFASVAALAVLFLASVMRLAAGTYNPFIYFRF